MDLRERGEDKGVSREESIMSFSNPTPIVQNKTNTRGAKKNQGLFLDLRFSFTKFIGPLNWAQLTTNFSKLSLQNICYYRGKYVCCLSSLAIYDY